MQRCPTAKGLLGQQDLIPSKLEVYLIATHDHRWSLVQFLSDWNEHPHQDSEIRWDTPELTVFWFILSAGKCPQILVSGNWTII